MTAHDLRDIEAWARASLTHSSYAPDSVLRGVLDMVTTVRDIVPLLPSPDEIVPGTGARILIERITELIAPFRKEGKS